MYQRLARFSRSACGGLLPVVLLGFGGCVDASAPQQPPIPQSDLLKAIAIAPDQIVIAVDSTVQLAVTAINLRGDPLPVDMNALVWSSSDSGRVMVDAKGKVTAKDTTSAAPVSVSARWTFKGVTQTASVVINVTPIQFPITRLRIVAPDSNRTSASSPSSNAFQAWTWMAIFADTGTSGVPSQPINSLILPLQPVDSLRALISFNYWGALADLFGKPRYASSNNSQVIGEYWLYTHAWIYGTVMRDSIKMTGLYPYDAEIPFSQDSATNGIFSRFINNDVIVQPCGEVRFINQLSIPVDIVFDDPAKATGCVAGDPTGNIEDVSPNGSVAGRKFRAVGTVRWTLRNRETGQLLPAVTGTITMKQP